MSIITPAQADRLWWLGRYTERTYTTSRLYAKSFDRMIDSDNPAGYRDFCRKLSIPDVYANARDFWTRYPFDENVPDSIASNLTRAYDNAIVLREEIGSEALSYVQLAVYAMDQARRDKAPLIKIQRVVDNILAFWGLCDDFIEQPEVRNLIKAGKRVERIDLYSRLQVNAEDLRREINRLVHRIDQCGIDYNEHAVKLLEALITAPKVQYGQITVAAEQVRA